MYLFCVLFLPVPDWGDKVNSGIGLSYWPAAPGYIGWRAGTTTLCPSQLYIPPSWTMNLATGDNHAD